MGNLPFVLLFYCSKLVTGRVAAAGLWTWLWSTFANFIWTLEEEGRRGGAPWIREGGFS